MKIVSYFGSIKDAHDAERKLNESGYGRAYTDLNDHYTLNNNPENSIPGTENAPSNASLVLNYGEPINNQDKAPLSAASPMVSGMGDFEEITDYNYKVIMDVNPDSLENAKSIIKSTGGNLNDPNLNIQNRIKDVSLDKNGISDLTT